jgi:hypothetical protein
MVWWGRRWQGGGNRREGDDLDGEVWVRVWGEQDIILWSNFHTSEIKRSVTRLHDTFTIENKAEEEKQQAATWEKRGGSGEQGALTDLPVLHGDEVLGVLAEGGGFRSNESLSVS